jgi:adenylyltransferase/sulfurtransferase
MSERYSRQTLLPWIGPDGQREIAASSVAVVGLGALGCTSASLLARAGIRRLLLVDRDFVEESNLPRQILYTESDAIQRLPKAVAVAAHLGEARSDLAVEALSADLDAELARRLFAECTVVLDGTDNFETRYLLNDASVESGTPWVYAGAVGETCSVMTVLPGASPCLRCLFPLAPPPGSAPTCETVGILAPAASVAASIQAGESLKILSGRADLCSRGLLSFDLLSGAFSRVAPPRVPQCTCCELKQLEFLNETAGSRTHRLCGRNGVMVLAPKGTHLDLKDTGARMAVFEPVFSNAYLLQTLWEGHPITLYADGRALVQGTNDPARARALYARYVGM